MFNKILVANRGEIAIRVMRACRELGIETVAVFSKADKHALHTKYADEAYLIGDAPPSDSYLNIERIIDVAEKSESEAIHPGYGFLAENPRFAKACEEAGIKFIGPKSDVIELMGSKIEARRVMRKAGLHTVPGSEGAVENEDEALEVAEEVGFPILIKASAGGGGIGMYVVNSKEELKEAIEKAKHISKSAFGDPTIFIEKYLPRPRHIEFQVLADEKGNVVSLGERECSIQRRHQKLIEEAPSVVVTEELREKMNDLVRKAAKSIGYTNAGTLEFLYHEGNLYFIEMNTRIQVEHGITELVTGIDIVKEQISIASGEELSFSQEEVEIRGHAIECRINAEDPLNDFMPSPGKIRKYRSPGGFGVRIDSGVRMGYIIPPHYDPMIAKLMVWGRNRQEAIARMRRALSEYIITGVKTNIAFHKAVMQDEAFIKGDISTRFIEERNIISKIPAILERDRAKEARWEEIFLEDKKVAAISTAIRTYIESKINQQKE